MYALWSIRGPRFTTLALLRVHRKERLDLLSRCIVTISHLSWCTSIPMFVVYTDIFADQLLESPQIPHAHYLCINSLRRTLIIDSCPGTASHSLQKLLWYAPQAYPVPIAGSSISTLHPVPTLQLAHCLQSCTTQPRLHFEPPYKRQRRRIGTTEKPPSFECP